MALTLLEYAKSSNDPRTSGIVELFAQNADLLTAMPFVPIQGAVEKTVQEETLPATAFRAINSAYTADEGKLDNVYDPLVICGGDMDVDHFILKTQGEAGWQARVRMKIKSLAQLFANRIVKGDSATDTDEFDGLQKRLTGAQLVSNNASTGAALSLYNLDATIDAVDEPTHLLMNKAMLRRLSASTRSSSVVGNLQYTKDSFGRPLAMYADLPILLADRNTDAYSTLAFNEAAEGGGTASTSIYVLSLRQGQLQGIQNGPIEPRTFMETHTAPVRRMRVEWYAGISMKHPRSAARLYGITDAAVVA